MPNRNHGRDYKGILQCVSPIQHLLIPATFVVNVSYAHEDWCGVPEKCLTLLPIQGRTRRVIITPIGENRVMRFVGIIPSSNSLDRMIQETC